MKVHPRRELPQLFFNDFNNIHIGRNEGTPEKGIATNLSILTKIIEFSSRNEGTPEKGIATLMINFNDKHFFS